MPSSNDIEIDDSIVLEALRRDAASDRVSSRYATPGTPNALTGSPRRLFGGSSGGAVRRPNLRFLSNIIQDTNAHNAALKLRELESAGDRLRVLKGEPPRDLQTAKHRRTGNRDHREGRDQHVSSRSRSQRRSRKHSWSRSRSASGSNDERRGQTTRYRGHGHERGARKRDASRSRSDSRDRYAHRRTGRSDSPRRHRRDAMTGSRSRTRHEGQNDGQDSSKERDYSRKRRRHHDRGRHRSLDDDHPDDDKASRSRRKKRLRSRNRSLDNPRRQDRSRRGRHRTERDSYRSTSRSTERARTHTDDLKETDTKSAAKVGSMSPGRLHVASQKTASASPRLQSTTSPQTRSRSSSIGPSPPDSLSALTRGKPYDSRPTAQSTEPIVRRGRGTYTTALTGSAIDKHFSSSYDPRRDIQPGASPPPAGERKADDADDWGSSLAALRARDEYRENQKKRLLAAGFSEEEVRRWDKGQGIGRASGTGEGDEESVRWSKKGESREWDRGKVLGEDGDVETAVDWNTEGRLL